MLQRERLWNHVALNADLFACEVVNQSRDEWRDIYRKTAQSSQGNLNPTFVQNLNLKEFS